MQTREETERWNGEKYIYKGTRKSEIRKTIDNEKVGRRENIDKGQNKGRKIQIGERRSDILQTVSRRTGKMY